MENEIKSVLYIASNSLNRRSADIVNIMEMCNAFSKLGCKIILVVPECGMTKNDLFNYYGTEFLFDIIQVSVPKLLRKKIIPGLSAIFSFLVIKMIRKFNVDIVYTRTPWIFFLISVINRRNCFFEAHQFRYQGSLTTFIYRALVKSSVESKKGSVVCISKELMKQWQKHGIDSARLYIAHDGVNTDKFNNNISKEEARLKLVLSPNKSIVVYTGTLIPGKGVDILLKAANKLPYIFFIIVGGDKDQIKYLGNLVKFRNVLFVGRMPHKKIPIYQSAADILALPNNKGSVIDDVTSPIKLFEYIASQRPIVATNIPSLLEILKNNYNALISTAGDYHELSENIKLLLKNPLLSQRLVKNARKDLEKYSWGFRAQYLLELFKDTNTRFLKQHGN